MKSKEANDLVSRIGGLHLAFGALVAELEDRGVIDGPRFSRALERSGQARADNPDTAAIGHTLLDIADRLDQAREGRHQ